MIDALSSTPVISATLGYQLVESSLDKQQAAFEKSGAVQNDINYFRTAIAKVTSADDLVKDYRLLKFTLTAFGLDSQINSQALIKKVLNSDLGDSESLANKLVDSRFRQLAQAFNFAAGGASKTQDASFVDGIVQKYVTAAFEQNAAQTNPGIRLALYFKRMAPGITSWYQVLGDVPLYNVMKTTFHVSALGPSGDVDKQAEFLEKRIGIANLQDPKFVDRFVTRFLASYDQANDTTASSVASLLVQPLTQDPTSSISLAASTILTLATQRG
ncbi:MAG TPA: DUF1217 domain-containing protein [Candidatus Acidoferrum sp.]|nr:DUF1217 domain-containing protein [Candidatus Acidoferrum sp.]